MLFPPEVKNEPPAVPAASMIGRRVRRILCLHQHDDLRVWDRETGRVFLRCQNCQRETAGWETRKSADR